MKEYVDIINQKKIFPAVRNVVLTIQNILMNVGKELYVYIRTAII